MSQLDFDAIDHENYDFAGCLTRRDRFGPYYDADVVAAIRVAQSSLIHIANLLGRNRNRVRDLIYSRPDLKAVFDETRETLLDHVEVSVFTSALNGDGPNQRFLLSTIGKSRGYSTRQELTGQDGAPMRIERVERVIIDPDPGDDL